MSLVSGEYFHRVHICAITDTHYPSMMFSVQMWLPVKVDFVVVTDLIRSMGEGNVFTGVCLFSGGGVTMCPSGGVWRPPPPRTHTPLAPSPDTYPLDTLHPHPSAARDTVNRRSECILVYWWPVPVTLVSAFDSKTLGSGEDLRTLLAV